MSSSTPRLSLQRSLPGLLVALVLILLIECVGFNLPFWTTLGASTDSAAALNTMGAGLKRDRYGMLEVTDPTAAWLEVKADGTSAYARIDVSNMPNAAHADVQPTTAVLVRADSDTAVGKTVFVSTQSPRSLYFKAPASLSIRLWIEEPIGSHIPFHAVRANVRVPFDFSWERVAAMALFVLLVALWRPGSRLWKVPLDPSSRWQRASLVALMIPFAVCTAITVFWQAAGASPLVFSSPHGYVYDFDQYDHVAQALLNGHVWLDLPVPQQLAQADLPHDTAVRSQLLADGVTPIYWDYAFYNGHWYSYFGVLPAVLLFMPYRAITSLWVDGGLLLPASVSVLITMFGFLVFGSLLVLRLIRRMFPNVSVAAASLAVTLFVFGSNSCYLWFRTNFYSVPVAASMMFTALGLWLWLGATPGRFPKPGAHVGSWVVDGAQPLSLRHLAGGALCIAANFGCRPTFTLAALLGFPLFWPQITSLVAGLKARTIPWRRALRAPAAVLVPALVVVAPLMAYNHARFGSVFDFGNNYQMTVTDMTRFTQPMANFMPTMIYYLFIPLRTINTFPYIGTSTVVFREWGYFEPMVGGLFITCPLLLLALAVPFLHKRLRATGYWPTLITMLALALLLMVFDGKTAGLGWRYMCDFAWMVSLAAIPVMVMVLQPATLSSSMTHAPRVRTVVAVRCIRAAIVLVMLATIVLLILTCFVVGRSDALMNNLPSLYATVSAWFRL
ncbi:glycosyltransferase [Bifidobacterium goeldii]|uniref:Glycosyltransferase n=1 Tax=Bifidobacterium goeldii TaxID=2306975 RepID=A0A430FK27_9BIFI|nr:glycosyltransferase [Bifidobacterium goeldii]RSX53186.1 glycosyltransferase [Bifidobacterium goeldii]